jgi:hypothetical protein
MTTKYVPTTKLGGASGRDSLRILWPKNWGGHDIKGNCVRVGHQ